MLADAHAVQRLARTLLADCYEDLALHDARAPSNTKNTKRLGFGKGILTARIAVAEAIGAQRAMEYGEDVGEANRRLHLAKYAFGIAEEISERGKIMAAAPERNRAPHLQEIQDGTDGSPI